MTDEQINQRVAETCGWKPKRQTKLTRTGHFKVSYENPPDYCTDLNAMHEAEESLIGDLWIGYVNKVANIEGSLFGIRATARQRAEAFLRTLGKWEEATDKESLTVGATTEDSSVDQERGQP